MRYNQFLSELDLRLAKYFEENRGYVQCMPYCSSCCEKGDYPLSALELEYLMQGYAELDNELKKVVQDNIKNMVRGEKCPFLADKKCSVYSHRPIVCRVHGLAYLCKENLVKVPYCVYAGKNYAQVYKNGEITINPIAENLDTPNLLRELEYGEIRNLCDWLR